MKNHLTTLLAIAASLGGITAVRAQVPQTINYQGRIVSNGTNFNGTGQFKFVLLPGAGPTAYWNNSDSATGTNQPAAAVSVPVVNGLYSVPLGDTSVSNMAAIPLTVFNNTDVRLRVWFNNGVNGFQMLTPDQRIAAVGYALMAANVADGVITSSKLGAGAVTANGLANGAVTAVKLAPGAIASAIGSDLNIGTNGVCGRVDVYSTDIGTPGVTLNGCFSRVSAYVQQNGAEGARLAALSSGGDLRLWDEQTNLTFLASSSVGGYLSVYNGTQYQTVFIDGHDANGGGLVSVRNKDGAVRAEMIGQDATGGGAMKVYDSSGSVGAEILGAESSSTGGKIRLRQADGRATVSLDGDANGQGGWIALYNNAGTKTIELDAKADEGKSRITTQVLEITGGADLSENFDITSAASDPQPGMIVCIDPENPGRLLTSSKAYDSTVAGIISGAGGVDPGMLMGQRGTKADGKHPVALTGRVYCFVDADRGAIRPGDLITTSDTRGHGMKASEAHRAPGAIIGKAMTGLSEGKGMVMVLVSLQ